MKKFLAIIAAILCISMLFISCSGDDVSSDDGTPDPDEAPADVITPDEDVDFILSQLNGEAAVSEDQAKEFLSKYGFSLSDIKIDGEAKELEIMLGKNGFYFKDDSETVYMSFDDAFHCVGIEIEDGILQNAVYIGEDVLEKYIEEVGLFVVPKTDDILGLELPKLTADDIEDKGDRKYTLKPDSIKKRVKKFVQELPDLELDADGEKIVDDILAGLNFDVEYVMGDYGFESIKLEMAIAPESIKDLTDYIFNVNMPDDVSIESLPTEYKFEMKGSSDKNGMQMSADVQIPMLQYIDGQLAVIDIVVDMDVLVDVSDILNITKPIFDAKFGLGMGAKIYDYTDGEFVLNEELTEEVSAVDGQGATLYAKLAGGKLEAGMSTNLDGEQTDAKISASVSFAIPTLPTPSMDIDEYLNKAEELDAKYDAMKKEVCGKFDKLLEKLDPSQETDLTNGVLYYSEEYGVWAMASFKYEDGRYYYDDYISYWMFKADIHEDYIYKIVDDGTGGILLYHTSSDEPLDGFFDYSYVGGITGGIENIY